MMLRPLALLIAAAGLASPIALAEPPTGDTPALGGPKIKETAVPGSSGATFGAGAEGQGKDRVREVPHVAWMRALNQTIGDGAPEGVRATPEQRAEIMALNDDFMKAQRDFMMQHKDELQQLRRKTGEYGQAGGPGGPGAGRPKPPTDEAMQGGEGMSETDAQQREQAMVRLRDLREAGPRPADVQKQIFALLTPDQQKAFEVNIAKVKAEMSDMEMQKRLPMEAKRVRERIGGPASEVPQKFGGEAPKKNPERNAGGDISPEQRDRVMALLARLTPEQREALIARMEERMAAEAAGRGPDAGTPPADGQGQQRRRLRNGGNPPPPPPPPAGG